jgi:hypothetical protein
VLLRISLSPCCKIMPFIYLYACCQVLPSLSTNAPATRCCALLSLYPPAVPLISLSPCYQVLLPLLTRSSCLPFLSLCSLAIRCCYPGVSLATCPTPTWTCSSSPLRGCWSSSWFMERSKPSLSSNLTENRRVRLHKDLQLYNHDSTTKCDCITIYKMTFTSLFYTLSFPRVRELTL